MMEHTDVAAEELIVALARLVDESELQGLCPRTITVSKEHANQVQAYSRVQGVTFNFSENEGEIYIGRVKLVIVGPGDREGTLGYDTDSVT